MKTEKEKKNGASLVEYALLITLIALVVLGALRAFGRELSSRYSSVNCSVQTA